MATAADARPLDGAAVRLNGRDRGTYTDEEGAFVLLSVPAGTHRVAVSMIGFGSVTRTVDVSAGATVELDVRLERRPLEVGGIQVSVVRPDLEPRAELSEREVRESNPKDAGELLRSLGGVDATRRGPLGLDPVVRGLRGTLSAGHDTNLGASETSASVSGRGGAGSYWTHGAWREGDDYEASDGQLVPGGFSSSEARGKVGLDVSDDSRISVSGGYQDQGPVEYSGRLLTAKFFYSSSVAAEWVTERREGALRRLEISAYRNDVSHAMDNRGKPTRMVMEGRSPPFSLNIDVDSDMEVWGGRAITDLAAGAWDVRLGADVYSAGRDADRTIRRRSDAYPGGPPAGTVLFGDQLWPDATITDLGLFGRGGTTLGTGVRVSGTLRLDRVHADANTPSEGFLDYLERTGHSTRMAQTETNLSGAATVGFDLGSRWDLFLGLGSAVRTADATERYSDHLQATKAQTAAEFMGTPNLDPERSTQADLWLEAAYPRAAFQLDLFGRHVSDYVTLALTDEDKRLPLPIFPTRVFRYVNGEADFLGGEASLTYGLTDALTARAVASYTWGRETVFPGGEGAAIEEPAFGLAPLRGRPGLRCEDPSGRWFLGGTTRLAADQDRVAGSRGETPTEGYELVDLHGGWAPVRGVNLRVGVENVLDEAYVNHLNSRNPYTGQPIPEPGRVVFADVSWAF